MKVTLDQNDANQNGFYFIVAINCTFYKMSKYKVIRSLFLQKKIQARLLFLFKVK